MAEGPGEPEGEDGKPCCIAHQPLTFHPVMMLYPPSVPQKRSLLMTASLL